MDWKKAKTISIVDIGSNTIRLCVYEISRSDRGFKKIADARDSVGLASYVDQAGMMSDSGIKAAAKSVSRMVRISRMAKSSKVILLATAAVRNCVNSKEVTRAISRAADCDVRILSGNDEACLSALGASWSTGIETGLAFDLGGGSTELAFLKKGRVLDCDSIPAGSLSCWKRFSSSAWCTLDECAEIQSYFSRLLKGSFASDIQESTIIGTGGSMRLALKIRDSLLPGGDKGLLLLSDLDAMLDLAESNPSKLYRALLETKPERTHTFLPACAIARSILLELGARQIAVSRHGLREGCLLAEIWSLKS